MQLRVAYREGELGAVQARALSTQLARLVSGLELAQVPVPSDPSGLASGEVFASPLELAILDGLADIGVLGLHELGVLLPEGLKLAAVTQRVDARDAAVTGNQMPLRVMGPGTRVLVDGLRRSSQLPRVRSDLVPVVRATPPEAIVAAVRAGEADAGLVALSDLRWMGLEQDAAEILAIDEMLPAPGQGALGLLVREERESLAEKAALAVHHKTTWTCVRAERAVVSALGSFADVPLGVFAEVGAGGALRLRAAVFGAGGAQLAYAEGSDAPERAAELAQQVAEELRRAGAEQMLREARAAMAKSSAGA